MDKGKIFSAVAPDYGGVELIQVSSLQLVKDQGQGWLVFFRAEAEGTAGIYCLQITKQGTVKPASIAPLDDPARDGILTAYHVLPAPKGYVLVYSKGSFLGITRLHADLSWDYLSAECPGIKKLDLRMSFKGGLPLYCGAVEREAGGDKLIDYYAYDGTTLTIKPVISMAAAAQVQYHFVMAPGGAAWMVYLAGGKLYGKALVNGNWNGLNGGNPLSAASGMDAFDYFILTDILYLFGYVPDGSGYQVYGCTVDTTNIVKQIKDGNRITNAAIKGRLSFAPVKDGNILFQYQEAAGGNSVIKKYSRNTDVLVDFPVTIPGIIISAGFVYYRSFTWLYVVNTLAVGKNKITL